MKIKHVAIRTSDSISDSGVRVSHLLVVIEDPQDPDSDVLLERFSDDPPGFNEIPIVILPSKP